MHLSDHISASLRNADVGLLRQGLFDMNNISRFAAKLRNFCETPLGSPWKSKTPLTGSPAPARGTPAPTPPDRTALQAVQPGATPAAAAPSAQPPTWNASRGPPPAACQALFSSPVRSPNKASARKSHRSDAEVVASLAKRYRSSAAASRAAGEADSAKRTSAAESEDVRRRLLDPAATDTAPAAPSGGSAAWSQMSVLLGPSPSATPLKLPAGKPGSFAQGGAALRSLPEKASAAGRRGSAGIDGPPGSPGGSGSSASAALDSLSQLDAEVLGESLRRQGERGAQGKKHGSGASLKVVRSKKSGARRSSRATAKAESASAESLEEASQDSTSVTSTAFQAERLPLLPEEGAESALSDAAGPKARFAVRLVLVDDEGLSAPGGGSGGSGAGTACGAALGEETPKSESEERPESVAATRQASGPELDQRLAAGASAAGTVLDVSETAAAAEAAAGVSGSDEGPVDRQDSEPGTGPAAASGAVALADAGHADGPVGPSDNVGLGRPASGGDLITLAGEAADVGIQSAVQSPALKQPEALSIGIPRLDEAQMAGLRDEDLITPTFAPAAGFGEIAVVKGRTSLAMDSSGRIRTR